MINRYMRITHLALDADIVHNMSERVSQCRYEELVPKRRTACLVVEKTDRHVPSLLDTLANNIHRALVRSDIMFESKCMYCAWIEIYFIRNINSIE